MASSLSGKLGAVTVNSLLEHRGKKRFVKDSFLLAVVDGCHRCLCIQKPATSRQPGAKLASQPIRMTPIRVPEFEVVTNREPIKLSSSAGMLSGLRSRDTTVSAVINLLGQYSKRSDAVCEVAFPEVRKTNIALDVVSYGSIQGAVESS